MRRRVSVNIDADESTERWLVSYADFITLLFAFFVVMYSISNVNLGKYRVLSESVSTAFSAQSSSPFPVGSQLGVSVQRAPISIGLKGQTGLVSMEETAARLDKRLKKWVKQGMVAVKGNEKWLEVEIRSSLLFTSGAASLTTSSRDVLKELSEVFKSSDSPLYVSGYTDDIPIATRRFPSNWELSTARAASVVRLFAEEGISASRMGAIGYAEFRPVVQNTSDANRQRNRRVVIRMLSGEDVFAGTSPFGDQSTNEAGQQVTPVTRLQPAEPVRSIFKAL